MAEPADIQYPQHKVRSVLQTWPYGGTEKNRALKIAFSVHVVSHLHEKLNFSAVNLGVGRVPDASLTHISC